jgi:hypothetical protein
MAELELGPLSDRLSDDEIAELANKMEKLGAPQLPRSDGESAILADAIDDDTLFEFNDRLDAHDLAAEIYLPIEFEGTIEVGGLRVGSAPLLVEVLEEVKDELDVDEDEDEEDDEEDEDRLMDAQLKALWKVFYDAAQVAVEKKLPLHVKG